MQLFIILNLHRLIDPSPLFCYYESVPTECAVNAATRGGAVAARWAHNPKVAGSSPAPATISTLSLRYTEVFVMLRI